VVIIPPDGMEVAVVVGRPDIGQDRWTVALTGPIEWGGLLGRQLAVRGDSGKTATVEVTRFNPAQHHPVPGMKVARVISTDPYPF
jgi:hypothetical protein